MKFLRFSRGAALIAAPFLLLPLAGIARAGEKQPAPPLHLKASSTWNLDYSVDSCRVGRFFGVGKERTLLQLTQFEPDHSFMLAIAGGGLGRSVRPSRVRVRFGPAFEVRDTEPEGAAIGKFEPGVLFVSMAVRATEQPEPSDKKEDQEWIANFVPPNPVTLEDEAKVEWIEVLTGNKPLLRLETGPMGELFKALNSCSEELVSDWGLDVETYRSLSRKPVPKDSPGKWLSGKDYPSRELLNGRRAVIYFRLMIDETGTPYECHIQQSGYSEAFDKSVCNGMMRRAQFEPALDSEGKPTRSFFRSSVLFQIP